MFPIGKQSSPRETQGKERIRNQHHREKTTLYVIIYAIQDIHSISRCQDQNVYTHPQFLKIDIPVIRDIHHDMQHVPYHILSTSIQLNSWQNFPSGKNKTWGKMTTKICLRA